MSKLVQKILHNNGSPSANDIASLLWKCCSSAAPVWISDLAIVLPWTKFKLFGLMVYCCWFSSQSFTKFPQCNRFLIRSKILSRIFLILQSFISRLSNELAWRDIPETSNTFIRIFLCYNSTFISFQFLAHSFPPPTAE